ncbi:MAG: cation-efflux pump [Chloroflexi bacterium]|nr:cation-efflux pump [Chloroflexota bacterium]
MAQSEKYRVVQRVLIGTLVANFVVAASKLGVGVLTSSLAMVADGIHSLFDGLSNVIGLVSSRLAAQPPDEDHPYGHRRIETFASLLIGGLLLLTAWEIVQSSIARLVQDARPEIGPLNFIVMGVSLLISLVVSSYEGHMGQRLNSELLLADAEHTRSDVWVSSTVILGLIAVALGLNWMDVVAALIVVGMIGLAAWRIVTRSAAILVDRVALDAQQVATTVNQVAGVEGVSRIRSRGPTDDIHLDVDVHLPSAMTTEQSSAIAKEIRSRLRGKFSGLQDIQVHIVPGESIGEQTPYTLTARAEAFALGLAVHEIVATTTEKGRYALRMHVEVPADHSLGAAHALVTQLEERLKASLRELDWVVTHIEPAPDQLDQPIHDQNAYRMAERALELATELYPDRDWHDLDIRLEADGGYAISLHCCLDAQVSVQDAHHFADEVATQIRAALPDIHAVVIHTEPPEHR